MRRVLPVFLLLAANAFAQEKTSAEKTPPTDDAIAGAKRDFDAIKSARSLNDAPKDGLPAFAPPEIPMSNANPRPPKAKKSALELKAEKKSANWLVDAMMKKDGKDETDELDPFAKDSSPLASERTISKRVEEKEKAAEKPEQAKIGPEFNPLTRYMSGWMTPQDFSLLKPGGDAPSAAAQVSRGDTSLAATAADFAPTAGGGDALDLMALSRSAPPAMLASPAENPYLQGFVPPAPNAAIFSAPPTSAASASTASGIFGPPVAPPPEKSRMPDFAKPPTDEKYFKQLKRF